MVCKECGKKMTCLLVNYVCDWCDKEEDEVEEKTEEVFIDFSMPQSETDKDEYNYEFWTNYFKGIVDDNDDEEESFLDFLPKIDVD